MTSFLKSLIKKSFLYPFIVRWRTSQRMKAEVREWEKAGRPVPAPALIKQQIVRGYGKRFGARVLVETGTLLGDMMEAQRRHFDRVYSIELHPKLAADAQNRFAAHPNVKIIQGDSAAQLPRLMKDINQRAVFWLDGHWSEGITARGDKDTPIIAELEAIFQGGARDSVLLVDDARCFTGENDYPTIEAMKQEIARRWPDYQFTVEQDIIRATPPEAARN